ncbi:MAG: myristoyl transferase [Chloroflexota bacterium]|nr:MAG: myristoyl transferase [Chloroflexota bacterium]
MKRIVVLIVVLILASLLTACKDEDDGQADQPKELTRVTVQLSWEDTIEFVGFYDAQDHGYFRSAGLDVQTLPGGFDSEGNVIDPIAAVLEGKAEFGVAGSDAIIAARAEGKPVVAVAAIYQRNPLAYIALADSGIQTPQDWKGKRLRAEPDIQFILAALLKNNGMDISDVEQVSLTDYSTAPLVNGEVDVMSVFVTNELITLQAQGVAYNLILPSDYGVELYSNVIFTTEQMIQDHPERVEALLRAVFKGYQHAIDNPAEAAKLSVARNANLTVENETASMVASIPLLNVPGSALGNMRPESWAFTMQMLLDAGALSEALDITQAYDLSFIEKIN